VNRTTQARAISSSGCGRCGKPTRDEAYTCEECLDDLADALRKVSWLDHELEVTLARRRAVTSDGATSSSGTADLAWHEAAGQARRELRKVLGIYAAYCVRRGVRHSDPNVFAPGDVPPRQREEVTAAQLAEWLTWRVDGLGIDPDGPAAVIVITKAVARGEKLIDRQPEMRYVGPCRCGRDLYRKPDSETVECRFCGRVHHAETITAALRAKVMGRLVTAREGALLLARLDLGVEQATIDKWRERKLLLERGHVGGDEKKPRLYLFDDLVQLAVRGTQRHAQRSPRSVGA
jgi:hypothetical protein